MTLKKSMFPNIKKKIKAFPQEYAVFQATSVYNSYLENFIFKYSWSLVRANKVVDLIFFK